MIYKRRAEIHRAFKVLESAIENKEAEIRQKVKMPEFPAFVDNLVSNSFGAVNASVGRLEGVVGSGLAFAQLVALKAQREIDRNPWSFLGKVALCGFGVGLMFGSRYGSRLGSRKRNSRSRGEK
jgi:hypothetical protein